MAEETPPTVAYIAILATTSTTGLTESKLSANQVLSRRTRADVANVEKVKKRELAFSSEDCWLTTGIPKIGCKLKKRKEEYCIRLCKYTKRHASKAT